ncbi:Copper amine oxidase N-terminal domain-containing protein [Tissierella praeacuta DSM 18095]|uniref:Copper amine oxidase N-terminal domain-containing protein n=1 Tax=Tissierella praeacuta DSM 18095 TaxID=1123404 RepID=A0A1M4ZUP7_9FIRM|nr:glycosyl hydrolase family 18 protein [Tissierella praeacuta]SHF21665.1 Copper amine oxidase N-terminal domain-containing protein [Tissierella praeacuta DSM 18095]SUP01956.1 Putative sporulation-specific glycosylase ydhD [Tissierella praeacuta]
MKKFTLISLIFLIIGCIVGVAYYWQLQPSKKVISYSDELYLIVEEQEVDNEDAVLFYDDILYFSLPVINNFIDKDIFYDDSEDVLIITNKEKVLRYKLDNNIATVNSKEFLTTNTIKKINEKIYIPIDVILKNYNIEVNYFEDTNAVVLDYKDINYLSGEIILDGAVIRSNLDIKAPILVKDMPIGTILNVYAEYESWYKVRTINGIPGFIEKKYLKINYTKELFKVEKTMEDSLKGFNKKPINLTWDYTYRKVKNTDGINLIPGVNIISPTWFSINGEESILDKGNTEYVRKYNDLGYEIWPLINNNFDPDLTHELLSKSSTREKLIKDILELYKYYGFQGINIDFENVHLKTKDLLTQFVRELYPVFKEAGMSVSIDVTGISTAENWSLCYDRKRLSEAVDYMILMAYDQHWASSPIAGSVAEYSWVEKTILGVLEYIPNNKLILGVPLYTRLWVEKDGKVSSQALSMEMANKFISENNMDLIWDDNSLQYYGQIEKDEKIYKIWLENKKSLEIKASLVHKYELAGIASWRKGFETADVWDSLHKVLN